LLLDMHMPGMSGSEVLEEMKSDMELHDVPVIVISGANDIELVTRCIEQGAEDYLDKPVNPGLLAARVRNVFERQRLRKFKTTFAEHLRAEKKRGDKLMNAILPAPIARELRTTGKVAQKKYDNVALLFCDVVGFTAFCAKHEPEEVVGRLAKLFNTFEEIASDYGLEKIKTIGDAFMATASLNLQLPDPLLAAVSCGLDMMEMTPEVCPGWTARCGVAEGPVIAGIVGNEKFQFDVWGDTVNVAARMASIGRPDVVTMPQECWLRSNGPYVGKILGTIDIKGKGPMRIVECTQLRATA
jgi:adenylate cyclase